jgi:hypothetical protein
MDSIRQDMVRLERRLGESYVKPAVSSNLTQQRPMDYPLVVTTQIIARVEVRRGIRARLRFRRHGGADRRMWSLFLGPSGSLHLPRAVRRHERDRLRLARERCFALQAPDSVRLHGQKRVIQASISRQGSRRLKFIALARWSEK